MYQVNVVYLRCFFRQLLEKVETESVVTKVYFVLFPILSGVLWSSFECLLTFPDHLGCFDHLQGLQWLLWLSAVPLSYSALSDFSCSPLSFLYFYLFIILPNKHRRYWGYEAIGLGDLLNKEHINSGLCWTIMWLSEVISWKSYYVTLIGDQKCHEQKTVKQISNFCQLCIYITQW